LPVSWAGLWPLRSPVIHNHWIAEHGLRGAYVLLPVQPEKLEQALRALPVLGISGCNLTIPHKVDAMNIVDHVDALGQRIGAVNTIVVNADGSLSGRNTERIWLIQSLFEAGSRWEPARWARLRGGRRWCCTRRDRRPAG